jgi:hypothetical protein
MIIKNYEDLKNDIVNLLARDDLAGMIPGWIDEVHKELVGNLIHLREIRFELKDQPLVAGVEQITLPTGTTRVDVIVIQGTIPQKLQIVSLDKLIDVRANSANSGQATPTAMHFLNQYTVLLGPASTSNIDYTIYYAASTIAEVDQDLLTSQVLQEAPDVLKYGVSVHAALFTRNAELGTVAKAEYNERAKRYGRQLFRARTDGGILRVRPGTMPADHHTIHFER